MTTRIAFLLLPALVACAGDQNYLSSEDDGASYAGEDGDYDQGASDTGDAGSETEEDQRLLTPATTDTYVFVANPDRDTVTRVSVPALDVVTVEVGNRPDEVATTADYALAVSFNLGSDDISLIDAETLDVTTVEIRPNLNRMHLSPDGAWVLCFHDVDHEDDEQDTGASGGVQSFNEISLVDTYTFDHFEMVVGQDPRQVTFTDDGTVALVVSDAELTVIDLAGGEPVAETVEIAEDPENPPAAEEIVVSPSGEYAFLRQYDTRELVVVDLDTLAVERVELEADPELELELTDIDLYPDGSMAVVVERKTGMLYLFDTEDPYTVAGEVRLPAGVSLGSLLMRPDGGEGILYTTASATTRYAIWDTDTDQFTVRELVKPVDNMSVSPDGNSLLVFHTREDADDADSSSPYYGEWALTLLDLDDYRTNPLALEAEPTEYAHSDDGTHGFFIMDGADWLEVIDYDSLIPEDIALKSTPTHVGTLPATDYAYASQEHPLGRISFYATGDATLETITGFELNAEIEH